MNMSMHEDKDSEQNKESYYSNEKIIKLIDQNRWDEIYNGLITDRIKKPNEILINGNNLFHMACIRGQTDFVEKIFDLCYSKRSDSNQNTDSDVPSSVPVKFGCGINPAYPNEEGLPGIHLYYKFGGRSKKLLQISSVCYLDREYRSLLTYLIDKIDLLEVYIDSTIEKSCLSNIELVATDDPKPDQNIYYLLIKQIKNLNKDHQNKKTKERYLRIIKLLMLNLSNKKAPHYAIAMEARDVFEYLIQEKLFDPLTRTVNQETPLIMAVYNDKPEFVNRILEVYSDLLNSEGQELPSIREYIEMYRIYSDGRPINTCIKDGFIHILRILVKYLKKWRDQNKDITPHTETDEYNSTYLHNLLMLDDDNQNNIGQILKEIGSDIVRYFVKYTDLNQQNYHGYTPAHLIFAKGYWKLDFVRDELKGRKVDLLKIDSDGKNIYSYIKKEDKSDFLKLTSELVLIPNTQGSTRIDEELHDMERIIDVVSRDKLKERKDYGLFNPSQLTYMLLAFYLENKHPNLYIPQRVYDEERKRDQQYLMEMTAYPISSIHGTLIMNEIMDHVNYYSYAPHLVAWHDRNMYTISPDLVEILKKQDKQDPDMNRRFVKIKILIVLSDKANHANCLVYDRKKREAWRFESYGLTDLVKDGEIMDMTLEKTLESVYGKIKYYSPSAYLGNIKFQLADNEDSSIARNMGDPGGYCMAWCIWFVDVICSNIGSTDNDDSSDREMTVDYLMRNYITRERLESDLFEEGGRKQKKIKPSNIYLEYIRQYGHHLDQEKNKIMRDIGLGRDMYYKISMSMSNMRKIEKRLRVSEVKYD